MNKLIYIYQEFVGGNFVLQKTNGAFNQVPIDHATEWVNKLCKLSNGESLTARKDSFCPEHQKMKPMSSHLLSSSNDLAYSLCVDQKMLP